MIWFWMILGAIMAAAFGFMFQKFQVPGKMSAGSWALTAVSILWGAFTLAWMASSIAEGEMQAAGMALLIFGAILVILIAITRKVILANSKLLTGNTAAAK